MLNTLRQPSDERITIFRRIYETNYRLSKRAFYFTIINFYNNFMRVENLIAKRLTEREPSVLLAFSILRKIYAANVEVIYTAILNPMRLDHVAFILNKITKYANK